MSNIEIEYALRPCFVDDVKEKALFHRWVDRAYPAEPSVRTGGHLGGQIKDTVGLVEFVDGSLSLIPIKNIQFVPGVFFEYCWE